MILETLASATTVGQQSRRAEGPPSATEHPPEETGPLSKDVIFALLSVERRRLVLRYLAENGAELPLGDLAEHIAAIENDTDVRLLSSKERKRVYIALYQCHLPKLDDARVIDFDQSRGTVTLRPEADELLAYLEMDPAGPDRSGSSSRFRPAGWLRGARDALRDWLQP